MLSLLDLGQIVRSIYKLSTRTDRAGESNLCSGGSAWLYFVLLHIDEGADSTVRGQMIIVSLALQTQYINS